MLTSSIAHAASVAASNLQTVAFDLGDSASGATDQQIFFPQGESSLAYGLLVLSIFFGVALGLMLNYLIMNNKTVLTGLVMFGYFVLIGAVSVSLGLAVSFWIGIGTVGGFFWARRVAKNLPNRAPSSNGK